MADDNKEIVTENLSVEDKINQLRKNYLKADIIWKLVSVVVFVIAGVYVVLVFKRIINLNFLANSLIVLALLVAIFCCVYLLPHFLKMNSKHKEYMTKYKEAFLKPTLEEAFSKGEYSDYEKISTRDLTRNSMLKKAKSAVANDCIRGTYKKIPFL